MRDNVKSTSPADVLHKSHDAPDAWFEHPSSGCRVTYETVRQAMRTSSSDPFPMSLTSADEITAVIWAVNQGIDSRLEACNCPSRGDSYNGGDRRVGKLVMCRTLECQVSAESMPVLLRRLTEIEYEEDDEAGQLVGCILDVIGVDDYGKFDPSRAANLD